MVAIVHQVDSMYLGQPNYILLHHNGVSRGRCLVTLPMTRAAGANLRAWAASIGTPLAVGIGCCFHSSFVCSGPLVRLRNASQWRTFVPTTQADGGGAGNNNRLVTNKEANTHSTKQKQQQQAAGALIAPPLLIGLGLPRPVVQTTPRSYT